MKGIIFRELQESLRDQGISLDDLMTLTLLVMGPKIATADFCELRAKLASPKAQRIADVLACRRDEWKKKSFPLWAIRGAEAVYQWDQSFRAIPKRGNNQHHTSAWKPMA